MDLTTFTRRRSHRAAAALIAISLLGLLGPVAPAAGQSLCTDEAPSLYLAAPKRIAFGRSADGYVQGDFGSGFDRSSPITVAFEPASPGKRLKHRFSVTRDALKDLPPLPIAKGDGKAQVTVSWTDTYYDYLPPTYDPVPSANCARSVTATVRPMRGKLPKISPRGGEGVVFRDRSCQGDESQYATGAVTVTVSGNGATRRAKLADQCTNRWRPRNSEAEGWRLNGAYGYLTFKVNNALGLGKHRFHWSIRFRHRFLKRGYFDVVLRQNPIYCAIFGC